MNTLRLLKVILFGVAIVWHGLSVAATVKSERTAIPNRVLPQHVAPKPGLHLSGNPTSEDISRVPLFTERLVPSGSEPRPDENADLARALIQYSQRGAVDDFSSLVSFLEKYPESPWKLSLLTVLGLEYYKATYYSRALEVWEEAWRTGREARDANGKLVVDRAISELAGLYSRLGRMNELAGLLKAVEQRPFIGGTTERISIAREVLEAMQTRPEVCFRCGPLALQSIKRSINPQAPVEMEIFNSKSTPQGFSLPEVAALSRKVGMDYQMAFRTEGVFAVPSVLHWKAGHYAAIVRQEGNRYLIEDPTFGSTMWATTQALESEASGYFLIPRGTLPTGWRNVTDAEGDKIHGKGTPATSDPDIYCPTDYQTRSCSLDSTGMPVSSVHLMLVNLQLRDTPVGYTPPVGPDVRFTLRYNHRDYLQNVGDLSKILGPKWTHDWDESLVPFGADMKYLVGGGGVRTFTKFNNATQTFAPNLYDQTLLRKVAADVFEMTWPNGSKRSFGPLFNRGGFLLSSITDPAGNSIKLTYDEDFRLVAVTDAIGQVTTFFYENPIRTQLITKVMDPFGRAAVFEYETMGIPTGAVNPGCTNIADYLELDFLVGVTDVIGLHSRFDYTFIESVPTNHACKFDAGSIRLVSDRIMSMTTPYGTTAFRMGSGTNANHTTFRYLETVYPDGSNDRVEYNQSDALGIPSEDPVELVPSELAPFNRYLYGRNTYYWSRTSAASSRGDHTRAKIYHWMHGPDLSIASGLLESVKEPLENRVWFSYPGGLLIPGTTAKPDRIGRVLDDGQTQLHVIECNEFGKPKHVVDPLGRELFLTYATNGIDLLELRQSRGKLKDRLWSATYNAQHKPIEIVSTAGQKTTLTYNQRGQLLSSTNPKGGTTTYTYSADGYLLTVDGPLPDNADSIEFGYDTYGRVRKVKDLRGFTLDAVYDDLDRMTRVTHPDGTVLQFAFDRLDIASFTDRAGRKTTYEYDPLRQLRKSTDPMGHETLYDWCRCGQMRSLTDAKGQTTTWQTDIQGRVIEKRYPDGSKITYVYEKSISRPSILVDELGQVTTYQWNLDNTPQSLTYNNANVPTPGLSFLYDRDYQRLVAMKDGSGITRYTYHPIEDPPRLGAGALSSVDGPLPHDTITYGYDEMNRLVKRAVDGVEVQVAFDALGRSFKTDGLLGEITTQFAGASPRVASRLLPNGQREERTFGDPKTDIALEKLRHLSAEALVSEFNYTYDTARGFITKWSQTQGDPTPSVFTLGYDPQNQLTSANLSKNGTVTSEHGYTYDAVGNRESESVNGTKILANFNGLNQLTASSVVLTERTNEWDALNRLVAVTIGDRRTEFRYDGVGRRVGIRSTVKGVEVSHRRFVWSGTELCEERDSSGAVVLKHYFPQGMVIHQGPLAGTYYYTRDHLGSIREVIDSKGVLRARYTYDPFGRRTRVMGEVDADFGFAGMFWSEETKLSLTYFRAYDAELGRWISRDPLPNADRILGPNLYAYVNNDPVSYVDRLGATPFRRISPFEPGPRPPLPVPPPPPRPSPVPPPAPPPVEIPIPSPVPSAPVNKLPRAPVFEIVYNGPNVPLEIRYPTSSAPPQLPCQGEPIPRPGSNPSTQPSTRVTNAALFALLLGYEFGTWINDKYHISSQAADMGFRAANWAEDQGFVESDADVLGAIVTLGTATPGPVTLLGMVLLDD